MFSNEKIIQRIFGSILVMNKIRENLCQIFDKHHNRAGLEHQIQKAEWQMTRKLKNDQLGKGDF